MKKEKRLTIIEIKGKEVGRFRNKHVFKFLSQSFLYFLHISFSLLITYVFAQLINIYLPRFYKLLPYFHVHLHLMAMSFWHALYLIFYCFERLAIRTNFMQTLHFTNWLVLFFFQFIICFLYLVIFIRQQLIDTFILVPSNLLSQIEIFIKDMFRPPSCHK